jgi:hypothetical protein
MAAMACGARSIVCSTPVHRPRGACVDALRIATMCTCFVVSTMPCLPRSQPFALLTQEANMLRLLTIFAVLPHITLSMPTEPNTENSVHPADDTGATHKVRCARFPSSTLYTNRPADFE